MGMNNLAIVLGPNLLRPRHESMLRMVEDSRHVNGIILMILLDYNYLLLVCYIYCYVFLYFNTYYDCL